MGLLGASNDARQPNSPSPPGRGGAWPSASLLVGHSPLAGMLPPRVSHLARRRSRQNRKLFLSRPLECKFWLNTIGALLCDRWTQSIGGEFRLPRARSNFVSVDIIEMSPSFRSQIVHLSFLHLLMVIQGIQKTLLTFQ